jgi:phage major head subunit gpT-like protein
VAVTVTQRKPGDTKVLTATAMLAKWQAGGLKIAVRPETLTIPVDLVFEAKRILESPGRVGTADNDLNALNAMGKFTNVVANHYLTDQDAWLIWYGQ